MTSRTRVLVADDHPAMLESLVRLLSKDFEVVASVARTSVGPAGRTRADLLVSDSQSGLNGIAAATT